MKNILYIDSVIHFSSYYCLENETFITEFETPNTKILNSMKMFFTQIDEMKSWEQNFFIIPQKSRNSFIFCPGPNIYDLLFSNGLNEIGKRKLDLYTLEWLFSVAMAIFIMQCKNIEYQGFSSKTVLIDSNMQARIINLTHVDYDRDTIIPYPFYFYSPEKCSYYISKKSKKKPDIEQRKKSDVYNYGVFMHELLTKTDHSISYFNNNTIFETIKKLEKGAIEYMNFDQKKDVPFKDLLYRCLEKDIKKRCSIEDVIQYLLDVQHIEKANNKINSKYFDINLVNIDKYHHFIIKVMDFEKNIQFSEAKKRIISMLQTKSELQTIKKVKFKKCSFEDLEKAYAKGINNSKNMIDCCYNYLFEEDQIQFKKFTKQHPNLSQFEIMSIFMQNHEESSIIAKNLNFFLKWHNFHLKKLSFQFQNILNKNLTLFDILYSQKANNIKISIGLKIHWLKSIAKQLKKLNDNHRNVITFSSQNLYLTEKMETILYVSKIFKKGSCNDDNKEIMKKIKKIMKSDDYDDISIYYLPPELISNQIDLQNINFDKCEIYSFGVLAKELIENNAPWLFMNTLSKKDKIKMMKKPKWRPFARNELNKQVNKFELSEHNREKIYHVLNQCLSIDANQRGTLENIIDALSLIVN